MLHTCKYPYVHAYTHLETQLPSFKTCPSTTELSPDIIVHHLFREAVSIPVITSLSGPWSTTWIAAADMNANKQPLSTCWTYSMILLPLHPRDWTGANLSSITNYKTVLTLTYVLTGNLLMSRWLHCDKFLQQNQLNALISQIYFWNKTTCFGQFLCPPSVFHCTHSNGVCHTGLLTACE